MLTGVTDPGKEASANFKCRTPCVADHDMRPSRSIQAHPPADRFATGLANGHTHMHILGALGTVMEGEVTGNNSCVSE